MYVAFVPWRTCRSRRSALGRMPQLFHDREIPPVIGGRRRHQDCFRCCMSNASTRSEGKGEELGGKIKAGVGKLIGNEQMEAEGRAQELEGEARQELNRK